MAGGSLLLRRSLLQFQTLQRLEQLLYLVAIKHAIRPLGMDIGER